MHRIIVAAAQRASPPLLRPGRGRPAEGRKSVKNNIATFPSIGTFAFSGGGNRRIPTGTHRTRGVRAYAAPSNIAHHDQACTMTSTLTHGSTNNAHRIAAIKAKQARNDQVGVPAAVALGLAYRAL